MPTRTLNLKTLMTKISNQTVVVYLNSSIFLNNTILETLPVISPIFFFRIRETGCMEHKTYKFSTLPTGQCVPPHDRLLRDSPKNTIKTWDEHVELKYPQFKPETFMVHVEKEFHFFLTLILHRSHAHCHSSHLAIVIILYFTVTELWHYCHCQFAEVDTGHKVTRKSEHSP